MVGGIVFIIFLYFASGLPYIMGYLTAPFLVIPNQLGLLERITQADVIPITLPSEQEFELPKEGKYFIYSNDILPAENRFLIKSQANNRALQTTVILDGVNGYGPEVVEGFPIYEFDAELDGAYEIYLRALPKNVEPPYEVFIVPAYSSRNGMIFFLSCLSHILIGAVIGRQIYYWRNRERIRTEMKVKDAKRAKFEAWLNKQK
jgi:hypothetical protein